MKNKLKQAHRRAVREIAQEDYDKQKYIMSEQIMGMI
jgi:hypothetical protein